MLCRCALILPQLFPSWKLPPSGAGNPKDTATGGEDPDKTWCNEQGSSVVVLSGQRSAGVLPEKSPARQLILFLSCI